MKNIIIKVRPLSLLSKYSAACIRAAILIFTIILFKLYSTFLFIKRSLETELNLYLY